MKNLLFLFTAVILFAAAAACGQTVGGTVFEDLNRNAILDPGEKGVAGVLVSNQLEVVKTNGQGRYILPVREEDIIYVIKPSGYNVLIDTLNLPRFYYIHDPDGSPPLKYPGIAPTGPLPGEINFPLYRTDSPDSFSVIVFADPQPRGKEEIDYIRDDVVAELVDHDAAFGIVLGDIMYDDLSLYDDYTNVLKEIGLPFYHVPGNHDTNYDAEGDRNSMETYKRHFGPPTYAFEYGKVSFIVLDVMDYKGRNEKGAPQFDGRIGPEQMKWLKNYLSHVPKDHLVVLNMHFPIWTFVGSHPSLQVLDRDTLAQVLINHDYRLALAGHMHMIEHQYLTEEHGWPGDKPLYQIICGAVSGSWWSGPMDTRGIPVADQRDGVPNGYHIFTFEGNQFHEFYKPAYFGTDFQMRISSPTGNISADSLRNIEIVVNVFDGNEKSVVECRIDGGESATMSREISTDPFFERMHSRNKELYLGWINPMKSVHIWKAPLPENLEPGIHSIVVKTTNQWGQSYQTARIFEVVQSK
ncbi:MAG: calcineurin-like phosphoesterase family protein [Calditrichaeota bacterium]|nr:calcineurin-like phosphoesterase family protein [Calditrichota bacterium]